MDQIKRDYPQEARAPLKVTGLWTKELYGPDGRMKGTWTNTNVICSNGLEFLVSFLNSAVAAAATFTMKYMAIGTGTGAEASSDTALGSESSRTTGTISYVSNAMYQIVATFATGSGTGAITEYGIFNKSTAACGTLWARDLESVINKGANDTLKVTAQITFS